MTTATESHDGEYRFSLRIEHRIGLSDVVFIIQLIDAKGEKINKKSILDTFCKYLRQDGEIIYEKDYLLDDLKTNKKDLIAIEDAEKIAREYFKFP